MANIQLGNNTYWDWSSVVLPASSSDLTKCVNLGANMDLVSEQDIFCMGVMTQSYVMYPGSLFTNAGNQITTTTSTISSPRIIYGTDAGTTVSSITAGNYSIITQGHVRLNNGLQIMWKPMNADTPHQSGYYAPSSFIGSGTKTNAFYSSAAVNAGTFATFGGTSKPFIEKPMVFAKVLNYPASDNWNVPEWIPFVSIYDTTATSWGSFIGYSANASVNVNTDHGRVVVLFAIGKWK